MRNFLKGLLPIVLVAVLLAGCDSNPTNEPSKADIDKANADRAAAIDNDASLTPEGKKIMKEKLGLTGAQPGTDRK